MHFLRFRSVLVAGSLALGLSLAGCCAAGQKMSVWQHVADHPGPMIVVYYPEHATWNSASVSTVIRIDGERIARICEGDFVAVPVEPGTHLVTTSTDEVLFGCGDVRDEPFPPTSVEVLDGPIFLRFGERPYPGPWSSAGICHRRLTEVALAKARTEADVMGLLGPRGNEGDPVDWPDRLAEQIDAAGANF